MSWASNIQFVLGIATAGALSATAGALSGITTAGVAPRFEFIS